MTVSQTIARPRSRSDAPSGPGGSDILHEPTARYLDQLKGVLDKLDIAGIAKVMHSLAEAHRRGARIYVFGNGGSGSTASHFVNDFNKGASAALRRGFRFHCLNDNVPTMTAIANDVDYDDVFVGQLRNHLDPGDVIIAISGSGNSPNVLRAVRFANVHGAETIALVGYDGGELMRLAALSIHVPVHDMQKVEDVHLALNHLMMSTLMEHLR